MSAPVEESDPVPDHLGEAESPCTQKDVEVIGVTMADW